MNFINAISIVRKSGGSITPPPPLYPPVANFTSSTTTAYEGEAIEFFDTSTVDPLGPAITNWLWTFEDGTPSTSTDQNPTVEWATAGTYDVSLQVTNSDGTDTKTVPNYMTIQVIPAYSGYTVDGINFNTNKTTPFNSFVVDGINLLLN